MLNDDSNSAGVAAPTNVGLAAFRVAIVQAKVFKKTLAEVSNRVETKAKELERKAELQREAVRAKLTAQRGGVDVVVGDTKSATKKDASQGQTQGQDSKPADTPQASGRGVDIKV